MLWLTRFWQCTTHWSSSIVHSLHGEGEPRLLGCSGVLDDGALDPGPDGVAQELPNLLPQVGECLEGME